MRVVTLDDGETVHNAFPTAGSRGENNWISRLVVQRFFLTRLARLQKT